MLLSLYTTSQALQVCTSLRLQTCWVRTVFQLQTMCKAQHLLQAQEIVGQIKEIDEDRQELLEYMGLEKQRKCLEYTMMDKELAEIETQLEEVRTMHCLVW